MNAKIVSIVDERDVDEVSDTKITSGQLEAVALRFHAELDNLFQRTGTGTIATLDNGVLSIEINHSLSAAEHNLMRRASGRDFFQHYLEELAEKMYPMFVKHIEDILPVFVTYSRVQVECVKDSIIFSFGVRTKVCWAESMAEAHNYRDYA